ncbi:MAG: hypothetical protein P9M08_04630 [Candidatus Erginobacter occultus]|nr:hypothetical protein [Candidatus Erginobacter occultus]
MKSGVLHIWVPELLARVGGIQNYSAELAEAAWQSSVPAGFAC